MTTIFLPLLVAFSLLLAPVLATFWWSSVAQLSMHANGPSSQAAQRYMQQHQHPQQQHLTAPGDPPVSLRDPGEMSLGGQNGAPRHLQANSETPQKPLIDCLSIEGLSAGQARMCRLFADHLPFVGLGARDAIMECQHQFKQRRWNCSTYGNGIMGPVHNQGTKEAAFTYAIVSAGVAHRVARGCKMGLLESCGCGTMITTTRKRGRKARKSTKDPPPEEIWHKEGCSDNIVYGFKFAQDFIDVREKEKVYEKGTDEYARATMNRWNNNIGRKLIKRRVKRKCKCHGVSGSCDIKTCWDHLAPLRDIGKALVRKYDVALHVHVSKYGYLRILPTPQTASAAHAHDPSSAPAAGAAAKKLKPGHYGRSKVRKKRKGSGSRANRMQLVYIQESPDYCKVNRTLGLTGTSGRQCAKDGAGPESCEDVCCGRGYNTHVRHTKERCRCDFKWCCKVECELCARTHYVHTCKSEY